MKVIIARSRGVNGSLLYAVHELLLSTTGPIEFDKTSESLSLTGDPTEAVDRNAIFRACVGLRERIRLADEDFLVVLLDRKNTENWFSSPDYGGSRSIFVDAFNWEVFVSAPPQYPIAFQVIENVLQALTFDSIDEGEPYFHDPPIGCINDMCSWKPDVTFKFRTADICGECQRVIDESGFPSGLVDQTVGLLEKLRAAMLFRSRLLSTSNAPGFPFPIAITRRKMLGTTDPFRRFLLLLDHFDSLVRCTVISLGRITMESTFDSFFHEHHLNHRPSLGNWVHALGVLAKGPGGTQVPSLSDQLNKRIQNVVRKAEDDQIVRVRNERRGHGYCDIHDSTYQELFLRHLATVQEIERLLLPFYARTSWCYTAAMSHPNSDSFNFRVIDLSGDHPDFKEDVRELTKSNGYDIPQTESVYVVVDTANTWYSLAPYVLYCSCPACGHNRVLVSDGPRYLDPYVGHLVNIA